MALSLCSCTNIKVLGLTLAESGGDGIYLGTATKGVTNKDITIKDVICDGNYRQGISVISADNLLFENTIMRNTGGTNPESGIDFEPNSPTERLTNIVLRKCRTEHNRGQGYQFYLNLMDASSAPVSVRFEKCVSVGETGCSTYVSSRNAPAQAVTGKIEFVGCTFSDAAGGGASVIDVPSTGCKVRFVNCSILDPAAGKPESAPIIFQSRRSSTEPIGGVEFASCTIRDSIERNPLVYIHGAGKAPLMAVSGTIELERRGARQTIKITPQLLEEWAAAAIPPSSSRP